MRFLDVVYNTLFHPVQVFEGIATGPSPKDRYLFYAVMIVALVSCGVAVAFPTAPSPGWLAFQIVFAIMGGLMLWIITGLTVSATAYVFGTRGRPQTFMILTGLSTLPCLFLPVIMLIEHPLGFAGNLLGILGSLLFWGWASYLFLMAIKVTYHLTLDRVIMALFLPMAMSALGFLWTANFLFNLFQVVR